MHSSGHLGGRVQPQVNTPVYTCLSMHTSPAHRSPSAPSVRTHPCPYTPNYTTLSTPLKVHAEIHFPFQVHAGIHTPCGQTNMSKNITLPATRSVNVRLRRGFAYLNAKFKNLMKTRPKFLAISSYTGVN